MTLQFKVGTFTKSVTTGLQSITGVGFFPGIIILHAASTVTNTFQADRRTYFGFASNPSAAGGTIEQASFGTQIRDSSSPSNTRSSFRTNTVWSDGMPSDTFSQLATVSHFTNDGFELDWTINDTTDYRITYVAIGANATVGTFDTKAATGNQIVSGVDMQPSFVFLLGTTHTSNDVVTSGNAGYSLGCFNNMGEQAMITCVSKNGVTTTSAQKHQRTDKCLTLYDPDNQSTITDEAHFIRMNLDGFTINWTTATSPSKKVIYAAFERCQSKIGTFTTPTSGTLPLQQSLSGLTFAPRGVMFMGVGET